MVLLQSMNDEDSSTVTLVLDGYSTDGYASYTSYHIMEIACCEDICLLVYNCLCLL